MKDISITIYKMKTRKLHPRKSRSRTQRSRTRQSPDYSKSQIYLIHDNGGRPFTVHVYSNKIIVNKNIYSLDTGFFEEGPTIFSSYYDQIFIGQHYESKKWPRNWPPHWPPSPSTTSKKYAGNSILILNKKTYTYIGSEIYSFTMDDDIIHSYFSLIGNSDVPYPIAVGDKYTYFMLERNRVLNSSLRDDSEPYSQLYKFKPSAKPLRPSKLKIKMIYKRII